MMEERAERKRMVCVLSDLHQLRQPDFEGFLYC